MNQRRLVTATAATALLLTAGIGAAQQNVMSKQDSKEKDKTLTIGDKAPKIDIQHWVKPGVLDDQGQFEAITSFDKDKVYVLEFWATWCGPCIASMPHLTELQEKYADYDVTFIGVSDEPLPTVVDFLFKEYPRDNKIHNERIGYTLTTDPDESVKTDYFRAAGQTGIPCAFIIGKDNRVEWIGHPMEMDEPLNKVVHDNWDRSAFKNQWEQQQAFQREMAKMQDEYFGAIRSGNHDKALGMLDTMLETYPDNLNLKFQKFDLLLVHMDKADQAYDLGYEIIEENWDTPMLLNQIAWNVATNEQIQTRNLDFALKAAKRANELTDSADAAILDTLARVYWEKGDKKTAIKWQKKAVKHAGDDPMGEQVRETLKQYESEM